MAVNPMRPWDEAEQAKLREELIRLAGVRPGLSLTAAMEAAQKVLPKPRRRVISKPWSLDWLNLPDGLYKRHYHPQGAAAAPAPEAAPEPTPEPQAKLASEPEAPAVTPPPQPVADNPRARAAATFKARIAAGEVKVGVRKDGGSRVFWKPQERRDVCRRMAILMLTDPLMAKVDAFNQAMRDVFADKPERMRPEIKYWTVQTYEWADPLIAEELHYARRVRQQQQEQAERERNEALQAAAEAAEAAANQAAELARQMEEERAALARAAQQAPAPVPAAFAPSGTADALGLIFGALRQRIVSEVASIFTEALGLAMQNMQQPPAVQQPPAPQPSEGKEARATADNPFPHNPFPAGARPEGQALTDEPPPRHVPFVREEPRPAKKSVLVVGLRGSQGEIIEKEFGKVLDLRFHGANDSKDQLRHLATNSDSTVLFVDKMGHSTEQLVRARSPDWHRSGGGMTNLRETLRRLIPQGAMTQ